MNKKYIFFPFFTPLLMSLGMMTTANISHAESQNNLQASNAEYSFVIDGKKGTATRTLKQTGDTWRYDVNANVYGVASAKQFSQFNIKNNAIVPKQASTTYKIFGFGKTHDINFNPSKKQVVSTYKGQTKTIAMPNQAFDDLSLEVQIRQELLNNKFSGNYPVVKKEHIEKTKFKKSGHDKISVPAGTFDTIRIDRVHGDKTRRTSFWLAPSLNYMPIKVSQINDGKAMELQLTKVR